MKQTSIDNTLNTLALSLLRLRVLMTLTLIILIAVFVPLPLVVAHYANGVLLTGLMYAAALFITYKLCTTAWSVYVDKYEELINDTARKLYVDELLNI